MCKNIVVFAVALSFLIKPPYAISKNEKYMTGEVIVRFAQREDGRYMKAEEANAIAATVCGGTVKKMSRFVEGLSLVKIPDNLTVEEAVSWFKNTPGIINAQPNFIYQVCREPNDPCFPYLWGLNNTGQPHPVEGGGFATGTPDADIDAPEAWDIATDSNIIVAVIDTGVDYNHPDLKANMWINPGEDHDPCGVVDPNDFDEVDDDENGYIDDIYGYDFCQWGKPRDSDPMDDMFHGTHVAGIIGAMGNNGLGVTGVCWNVKIMVLKFLSSDGHGNTYDAIDCIYYAISKGAKILNNSWGGGDYDESLKGAIEAADANGILFVASAGNDGYDNDWTPHYPSNYDCNNIIAVMATDANDQKAGFSNYGSTSVDLAAPGVDIFSTFPTYETSEMNYWGYDVNYETGSGTSAAAPYVSGACALLWALHPNMTHHQVKQGILEAVDKLDSLETGCEGGQCCLTGGRLNLYNALLYRPHLFTLTKEDDVNDVNCVLPGQHITYTISYDANGHSDSNVVIIDYLQVEVDYNWSSPEGIFDEVKRTVTWDVGTVSIGDSNSFTLKVLVNGLAEPLGAVRNVCMFEGDHSRGFAEVNTPVCSWNPEVIYVDDSADSGRNTGMRWEDAYRDLQNALDKVAIGCGSQIWVAGGNYTPSVLDEWGCPTFYLVNGIPLYGHFAGKETLISQRNLEDPSSETILSSSNQNSDIVTASGLDQNTILDGFTMTGSWSGVAIKNAHLLVSNCLIHDSSHQGIRTEDSNFTVTDCVIRDNGFSEPYAGIGALNSSFTVAGCVIRNNNSYGIYADFSYNQAIQTRIENNIIRNNSSDGIYLYSINSIVTILNNIIHDNGNRGIELHAAQGYSPDITIRNNTIVRNGECGIYPNIDVGPDVNNCIIWGHGTEYEWYGWDETFTATYSCIRPDSSNDYNGEGNIHSDPCFVDEDANNFHLKPASDCIDTGDPSFNDFNETDIDGECRILFGKTALRVDMGADEVYWPKADIDQNGIVNFIDYALWAPYWLTDDPNGRLDGDDDVDIYDLAQFCEDWLWVAPWSELYDMLMGQSGGDMSTPVESESEPQVLTEDIPSDETSEIIDQPMSNEQIQELIDWTEELWESSPDLRAMVDPDDYQRVLESLRDQLDD